MDAAIATNLVLAVVCPHLCGVGGDLLAMVFDGSDLVGIESSGALPMRALLPDDGRVPERGIGSVTVPGAPAGWTALHARFGTVPLRDLAEPAISYAREGFTPSPSLVRSLDRSADLLSRDPEATRIFLTGGTIANPELADVLADLPSFYEGPVARACPEPFTPEDFAAHEVTWVQPMRTRWMDVDVCEMPPNSRGHLVLEALEKIGSLDGLDDHDPRFHLRLMESIGAVSPTGDTVYLCVWDESGLVVSLNESNYMGFGSGVVVPGTGVHLHNRGAYHTPESYRPGAKPVHTLSPAMAFRDGAVDMAFGTMGGEAQVQIHLQLLARVYVLGYDPQHAVSAPRWVKHHHGELLLEEGLPEKLPGKVVPRGDHAGHAHIIRKFGSGLSAGADPRADSLAAGY